MMTTMMMMMMTTTTMMSMTRMTMMKMCWRIDLRCVSRGYIAVIYGV